MKEEEFYRQRSIEVAWALFRVAQTITKNSLQEAFEKIAVEFLVSKKHSSLEVAKDLVVLAEHINQLHRKNASVLMREIEKLIIYYNQHQSDTKTTVMDALCDESLESIFSGESLDSFLSQDSQEMQKNNNVLDNNTKAVDKSKALEQRSMTVNKPLYEAKNSGKEIRNESEQATVTKNSFAQTLATYAKDKYGISMKSGNVSGNQKDAKIQKSFGQRKELILSVLSKKNLCHMRDFSAVLPEVSERTLRYDIQRLAEEHIVERVGSGGPNSFLRLKHTQSAVL